MENTIFTKARGGIKCEAIRLSWDEVHEVLGKDHEGSPEDDQKLTEYMLREGAPDWVQSTDIQGFVDETGWLVFRDPPTEFRFDILTLDGCRLLTLTVLADNLKVGMLEAAASWARRWNPRAGVHLLQGDPPKQSRYVPTTGADGVVKMHHNRAVCIREAL